MLFHQYLDGIFYKTGGSLHSCYCCVGLPLRLLLCISSGGGARIFDASSDEPPLACREQRQ